MFPLIKSIRRYGESPGSGASCLSSGTPAAFCYEHCMCHAKFGKSRSDVRFCVKLFFNALFYMDEMELFEPVRVEEKLNTAWCRVMCGQVLFAEHQKPAPSVSWLLPNKQLIAMGQRCRDLEFLGADRGETPRVAMLICRFSGRLRFIAGRNKRCLAGAHADSGAKSEGQVIRLVLIRQTGGYPVPAAHRSYVPVRDACHAVRLEPGLTRQSSRVCARYSSLREAFAERRAGWQFYPPA